MPLVNFAGIASGIDSAGIIDAIIQQETNARITPKEKKVTDLEETNSVLAELDDKFTALKAVLEDFTTITANFPVNQAESSDETTASATASGTAIPGTYALTVTTLAKNATTSFSDSFSSPSAVINSAITPTGNSDVVYTIGNGSDQITVTIPVTATTTVDEFITTFNNTTTRATASAVNVGTSAAPDYRIVVNTNDSGTQKGEIVSIAVGSDITSAGSFAAAPTTSNATNAVFSLSGISGSIIRQTNDVADVISGVTFNLKTGAGATATITVGKDSAGSTGKVQEFIDQYNEIVTFITENNLIIREEEGEDVTNIFGPLSSTDVDNNALFAIRSEIAGAVYNSGSLVKIFADIGITTERDGTLKFKSEDFQKALASEPNSVTQLSRIFADRVATTGGTIDQFVRFNGLFDTVVNNNKSLVTDINDQIARAQALIDKQAETIRLRFARLEGLIGGYQSQQNALNSVLSGL